MPINWSKKWQGIDAGNIIYGMDLRKFQNDVAISLGSAISLNGYDIDAPEAADDGKALVWDDGAGVFTYADLSYTLSNKVGTFTKAINALGTSSYAVTGVGFEPKLVLFCAALVGGDYEMCVSGGIVGAGVGAGVASAYRGTPPANPGRFTPAQYALLLDAYYLGSGNFLRCYIESFDA